MFFTNNNKIVNKRFFQPLKPTKTTTLTHNLYVRNSEHHIVSIPNSVSLHRGAPHTEWKLKTTSKSIAVLFFGRTNKCKDTYNRIIDALGRPDVVASFSSGHRRDDASGSLATGRIDISDVDFFLSSDNSNADDIQSFIDLYNPTALCNEPIIINCDTDLLLQKTHISTNLDNMLRHFTNKKRVFSLFETYCSENNIQYNIVLSIRLDLMIYNNFIFDKVEQNTVYVPGGNDHQASDKGSLNDQIAYGLPSVMKIYMNIFDELENLVKNNDYIVHPETLTYGNLILHNINIKRFDLSYHIIR